MRSFLLIGAALAAGAVATGACAGEGRPPFAARPGQCFQKVVEAPPARVSRRRVLVAPARVETRIIPARTHWEERPVLLEPERRERIDIPPVVREVTETVVTRPASVQVSTIPGEYRDAPEMVMVRPARRYWRRSEAVPGYGPDWSGATQTGPGGEVLCLVEEPAVYQTVWRRVCVRPAQRVETPVPAETRLVTRRVVDQPGRVETRVIPARWGSRRVEVVDAPARVERIRMPAVYRDVEHRTSLGRGRVRWVRTACAPAAPPPPPPCARMCAPPPAPPPCDPCRAPAPPPPQAMDPDGEFAGPSMRPRPRRHMRFDARPGREETVNNPVSDMQRALSDRGYYRGPMDGLFNADAADALHRFQRNRGLAEGPLTHESARALGVER